MTVKRDIDPDMRSRGQNRSLVDALEFEMQPRVPPCGRWGHGLEGRDSWRAWHRSWSRAIRAY